MMGIQAAIHWVLSHIDINRNKQADTLAKMATKWREGKEKTGPKAPIFPLLQSLLSVAKRITKARLKAY